MHFSSSVGVFYNEEPPSLAALVRGPIALEPRGAQAFAWRSGFIDERFPVVGPVIRSPGVIGTGGWI